MTRIQLIGVPTDIGASVLGASMGPDALRIAGIAAALRGRGLAVLDAGQLAGPANPQTQAMAGVRHLPEVLTWNQAVFGAVTAALQTGAVPLLMGGRPLSGDRFHQRRGRPLPRPGAALEGAVAGRACRCQYPGDLAQRQFARYAGGLFIGVGAAGIATGGGLAGLAGAANHANWRAQRRCA